MNPVNLYISTCRYIIQSNPEDQDTWVELYRYLPYLRQSLSCCVCTRVFDCPMGPEFSRCYHHVCKSCIGGKMRIKPVCGWCNDFSAFVEKPQLKVIVQCFKKLCEYLASTAITNNLSSADNGGTSKGNQLLTIIQEAIAIRNDYTSYQNETTALLPPVLQKVDTVPTVVNNSDSLNKTVNSNVQSVKISKRRIKRSKVKHSKYRYVNRNINRKSSVDNIQNNDHDADLLKKSEVNSEVKHVKSTNDSNASTQSKCNSSFGKHDINSKISETVKAEHDYIKEFPVPQTEKSTVLRVKSRKSSSCILQDGETTNKKLKTVKSEKLISDSKNNNNSSTADKSKVKSNNKNNKQQNYGCRCGLATPKPGNLTCCGQRCPCYSAYKGCESCKCRGCRNPRGDPAKNPLAAMRLQRQLQNIQIIQATPISHSGIENIEISQTMLPVHACIEDEDIDIDV